jgi:lipopolysaccharide/colanic/teichoic acid biosynthesis glycosyltransferase
MADSGRPYLIEEALFRGAFVRERKRADRSGRHLALLLIHMNDSAGQQTPSIWRAISASLCAAKRETDVIGWFKRRSVLGLIIVDVPADNSGFAREVHARVQRELARRLSPRTISHLTVRLHAHARTRSGAPVRAVDPVLLNARDWRTAINDTAKRTLDIAGSATMLTLLAPLFLIIAALVKLKSPGPIFYRQERVGEMMKPFTILKFRTMHTNANHAIHHQFVSSFIKSGAEAQEAGKKGVYKITNDPRVTPMGALLRKTSLDELPQLWNVLRGDMSLVGPRPPIQYEVDQYEPWHCRRVLEAKPGITGLWQVNGRSRTTFDDMVRLDLRYAKKPSFWTDVKILLATPRAIIAGKGAC